MKYIVTGASGHLGINIVNMLTEQKKCVIDFDKNSSEHFPDSPYLKFIKGDVTSQADVDNLFKSVNDEIIVIHSAGIVSIASKYNQKVYDVNVIGTKNMVTESLKYKVNKFIYVSSVHAIPEGKKGSL